MTKQLDPFSIQIVANYLKYKEDYLNIIQVKKQFQYVLDWFRINPIPITEETKNLFQCIETQQVFKPKDESNELILENINIIQYNYKINYSEMIQMKEENKNKTMKFKKVSYSQEDRTKYGDEIPKEVTILDKACFKNNTLTRIEIPSTITK